MSVYGCYQTIKKTYDACISTTDKWLSKKVVWLMGGKEYTNFARGLVQGITFGFTYGAIQAVHVVYEESTPDTTKNLTTAAICTLAGILALTSEVFYRYQPNFILPR